MYVGPQQADTRARTTVTPRRGKVVHPGHTFGLSTRREPPWSGLRECEFRSIITTRLVKNVQNVTSWLENISISDFGFGRYQVQSAGTMYKNVKQVVTTRFLEVNSGSSRNHTVSRVLWGVKSVSAGLHVHRSAICRDSSVCNRRNITVGIVQLTVVVEDACRLARTHSLFFRFLPLRKTLLTLLTEVKLTKYWSLTHCR